MNRPPGSLATRAALLSLLPALAASAAAGEPAPEPSAPAAVTVYLESDLVSRYLWRGFAYSRRHALQSTASLEWQGWEAGVWGNLVLGAEPQQGHFNEFDFSLARSLNLGRWEVTPALVQYEYPHQRGELSATEIGVGFAYPLTRELRWIATPYVHPFRHSAAFFLESAIEWTREYRSGDSVVVTGALGYASSRFNSVYAGVDSGALNVLRLDLSWTHVLGSGLFLRPHVSISSLVAPALRRKLRGTDNAAVGIAVGWES